MKRKVMLSAVLMVALGAGVPAQVAGKKEKLGAYLPDLKASLVSAGGKKAVVRVSNVCKGDAPASRIMMIVYKGATKQSGPDLYMDRDVPPLSGAASTKIGKRSASVVFSLEGNAKIQSFEGRFIRLEVDSFNKIKEASEGNNWWEPIAQPFPDKGGYCDSP